MAGRQGRGMRACRQGPPVLAAKARGCAPAERAAARATPGNTTTSWPRRWPPHGAPEQGLPSK
eukprot:11905325-Alexandrium_andersonii.AAC.1